MFDKEIRDVVILRKRSKAVKGARLEAEAAMYATPEGKKYKRLALIVKEVSAALKAAELLLRAQIVANFDGENKKPAPGLGVRVGKPKHEVVTHVSPYELVQWAREHAPSALAVDTEYFENMAIEGKVPPEIATVLETPGKVTGTIASKLEEMYDV